MLLEVLKCLFPGFSPVNISTISKMKPMLQSHNLCIYFLVADMMCLIMACNKFNEQGGSAFDFEFG